MAAQPQFLEISPAPAVHEVLTQFEGEDGLILFESVRVDDKLGRYSFLVAEPHAVSTLHKASFGIDPFQEVQELTKSFHAETIPELPPFQGGCAGLLSYELGQCWEKLPAAKHDEFQLPAAIIGVYNWVIAWDHLQQRSWIIAHGFSASDHASRQRLAQRTCHEIQERIRAGASAQSSSSLTTSGKSIQLETKQQRVSSGDDVFSNFSESQYQTAVQQVIDYIFAGDIFQANLSQRFTTEINDKPINIYNALRKHNPAPFAGLIQFADWAVHSSSPERFIQKVGDQVWTRPIKGTRQRRQVPEADLYTRDELRESQKDYAENVMIVDLLRNDLSRVCKAGSIRVPELCSIEAYETVTHLVSEVTGNLQAGTNFWDLLRATFPGGSITGAPKIRAMEIITELEMVARGPYCGSMFYLGFDGTADSNILIRTIVQRGGQLSFSAGGGIVSQSNPKSEFEETLHKSQGISSAIRSL